MSTDTTKAPKVKEGKAGYSNFKDPLGLLLRMLKSGNKAAYFTLFREGLSMLTPPLDYLLAPLEKKTLKKGLKSDLPVILILGGSRSGTTLLYQILAQYLPVSYFDNLSVAFPHSPVTSGMLFGRFFNRKRKNFQNYFGSVAGFSGPNDGFHIWNRWFGQDRNVPVDHMDRPTLEDMGNFLHTWNASFGKPLLNKNNRNSLCVPFFEAALPEQVCYIVIRRDPVFVVQSLIQSREIVQGDKRISWGLGAAEGDFPEEADPLAYIDEVCEQVFGVEQQIRKFMQGIDPERRMEISYEEFCDDPAKVVQAAGRHFLKRSIAEKELRDLTPFKDTNFKRLPDEEFERIEAGVAKRFGQRQVKI